MPRRRRTSALAAVLAVGYVGALAFFGVQSYPEGAPQLPPSELIGRIAPNALSSALAADGAMPLLWAMLLFVPVGVLAYLTLPRWAWPISLLVGPTISVLIELTQWAVAPGQIADPLDVLCNSIGASLGVGVAALATLLAARPRSAPGPARAAFPPLPSAVEQTN